MLVYQRQGRLDAESAMGHMQQQMAHQVKRVEHVESLVAAQAQVVVGLRAWLIAKRDNKDCPTGDWHAYRGCIIELDRLAAVAPKE
jgi:hypothetical protein